MSDPLTGGGWAVPPHNYEAEQGLLGAILSNNQAYHRVSELLRPEYFADPVHGRIYEACTRLIERGQLANPVTLKGLFDKDGALAGIGGAQYLVKLAGAVVNVVSVGSYAATVQDLWLRRELLVEGQKLTDYAANMEGVVLAGIDHDEESLKDLTGAKLLEATERRLAELGRLAAGSRDRSAQMDKIVSRLSEQVDKAHRMADNARGATTGIAALDRALGVLGAGDLIVLAARPSMGKTGLAVNIAARVAQRALDDPQALPRAVAIYSLEMSSEQLAARMIAERTGIPTDRQTGGRMSNEEWDSFVKAGQDVAALPILVDDEPGLTVPQIRARARRAMRRTKVGLIVVDYIQLIRSARTGGREVNRVQEVTEITRGLKELARELELPVIALSQLSRAVEDREDRRPQLRDLRDSGSIEQDADIVLFIHRESYYLERDKPQKRSGESDQKFSARIEEHSRLSDLHHGRAELIVGKHRKGKAPQTVTVAFDARAVRFSDLDAQSNEQELPMGGIS